MKFKQKISQLLKKYETFPYNQYYLTLTGMRQHYIDEYYLHREEGAV